ncbi:MAG: hypothetical protein OXD54_06030 [Candidatus Poribacteria bacterium]|nr:hypothetical protein [Candidatus Poribacteria bacterium]
MKLSENQEVVQNLKQILIDYPGLNFDAESSAHVDNKLIVKVTTENKYDVNTAIDIARKLIIATGDQYIAQFLSEFNGTSQANMTGFIICQVTSHRNVRITYPDKRTGILEVDIVEGLKPSLQLNDPHLLLYAKDNVLEIQLNIYAPPNYRKFIRCHTIRINVNYDQNLENTNFLNVEVDKIDNGTD